MLTQPDCGRAALAAGNEGGDGTRAGTGGDFEILHALGDAFLDHALAEVGRVVEMDLVGDACSSGVKP